MFFIRYIGAELRRRKGRTALTALGLGVGVGLVVTVSSLSTGLDEAQSEVLDPLTGVGTDMSVTRPMFTREEGGAGPPEGGPQEFRLDNLGGAGDRFTEQQFLSPNASFSQTQARKAAAVDEVESVAAALTLDQVDISGELPAQPQAGGDSAVQIAPSPEAIDFEASTISGFAPSDRDLAVVKPNQVVKGEYLAAGERRSALVSTSYAAENDIEVGEPVKVGDARFEVVGLASAPIGGESSDIYVQLTELQKLAGREGEVNVLTVRAGDARSVSSVSKGVEAAIPGAEVTTAQDLADQVTGSLVNAKDLSDKLGVALAAVGLLGAISIATLLTLSSVNKRTRELGTLKALGWSRALVVRQVAGESLAQGALGGLAGTAIGVGGAALIGALGIDLTATVEAAQQFPGVPPGAPGGGVATESAEVVLDAPVDPALLLAAVGLAMGAGLLAGAIGAARAARLRPAEALSSVE